MKTFRNYLLLSIPPIALIMAITYLYQNVPSVNRFWFITRHVLIFLLMFYLFGLACILGYRYYKNQKLSLNKLKMYRIVFTILFLVLTISFGHSQIQFAKTVETPNLLYCMYYDQFDNLIYTSQYNASCPELESVSLKENERGQLTLSFTVEEEVNHKDQISNLTVNLMYTYYEAGLIQSMNLESRTENYRIEEGYSFLDETKMNSIIEVVLSKSWSMIIHQIK